MPDLEYCTVLGKTLTALRTQRGLTAKDVAEHLGIRKTQLVGYELGDLRPPLPILRKLATLYEVGLLRLLVTATEPDPRRIPPAVDGPDATLIENVLTAFIESGPVAGRLRGLRTARGMYPRNVSEATGVPKQSVTDWEQKSPPLRGLSLLAPLYDHTLLTLLFYLTWPTIRPPKLALSPGDAEIMQSAVLAWGTARGALLVAQQNARSLPVMEDHFIVRLGRTMQLLRTKQGWTLDQFAQHARVSVSGISACENALTRTSPTRLGALCTALGTGLLRCLVHAAEPASVDVPQDIGGDDAGPIETALKRWDVAAPCRSDYDTGDTTTTVLMGQRLRELREERGLSLMTVATDIAITSENLRMMEVGHSRPSLTHLDALARRYGLSLLPLLLRVMEPPLKEQSSRLDHLGVGGDDADRIVAALLAWDTTTGRSTPVVTTDGTEARATGTAAAARRRTREGPSVASRRRKSATPAPPSSYARAHTQALKHLREQAGLTQAQVAERIGVNPHSIPAVERVMGRRDIVIACCAHYGVSVLRLLVHLDDPKSTGLPASVGGADETRIVAAVAAWAVGVGRPAPARTDYLARLGSTLTELRTRRSLSVMDVARDALIDTRTLTLIERGERIPRLHLLKPIADFYGVGLLSLLAHLADPTWPIDQPIGGPDADRVTAALLTWDSDPHDDYTPPAPLQAPLPRPA